MEKIPITLNCGLQYETVSQAHDYAHGLIEAFKFRVARGNRSVDDLCEMDPRIDVAGQEARVYLDETSMLGRSLALDQLYLTLAARRSHEIISRENKGDYTQALNGAVALKHQIKQRQDALQT